MIFAEFYGDSTGWNGTDYSGPVELIPKCGSDGVFRLDGRKSRCNQIQAAVVHARKIPHVKGVRLMAGRSYLFNRPLTDIILIPTA